MNPPGQVPSDVGVRVAGVRGHRDRVCADVGGADVRALITGCLARERGQAGQAARRRVIAIACDGLRVCP